MDSAMDRGDYVTTGNLSILDRLQLTSRQKQAVVLMLDGHSNAAIASCLFTNEKAVKSLVTAIYKKTGYESRAQFIVAIAKLGWTFEGSSKNSTPVQNFDSPKLPRGQ